MKSRFDVIVVGAGPAGSTAAYTLAKKGFDVLVVERGRSPGSKTLYGGRVYAKPLKEIYPEFEKKAPIERWVKKERMTFMAEGGSLTLEYSSKTSTSFTAYLSKLSEWMASQAEEAGAVIVTDVRVDSFLKEDGRITGVRAGQDEVRAGVVIDAEGVNRLLLERLGWVPKLEKSQVALGLKETYRLGSEKIEERLGLGKKEGMAWFMIGSATGNIPGGAFLYTYQNTVALGIVVFLHKAVEHAQQHIFEYLEELRLSPPFSNLLKDGVLVEYGAHLTPELGLKLKPPRLYGDGFLIVGDAAGLLLNLGYTVRGVDFAAYSGYLAAQAVEKAGGDYSARSLSIYEDMLEESFIMRELRRHARVSKLMENERFFTTYPELAFALAHRLFEFEETSPTFLEAFRETTKGRVSKLRLLLDMLEVARGP